MNPLFPPPIAPDNPIMPQQRGQFVNVPPPPPPSRGGMFGGGKVSIDLSRALAGYLAGIGNPAGMQTLQALNAMRQQQLEHQQSIDDYNRRRTDDNADYVTHLQQKAQYDPPSNDTVNDYNFWKSVLPPEQFQQYVANKVNPPQLMEVPGVGLVSVPRMATPQGAPPAPVGNLKPYNPGGPASQAPGGFPGY
jgi:hypothetical protein